MVDKCIKKILGKILVPKTIVCTVLKKVMVIALSYSIIENRLLYCNIWFVFQTKCKISNFLHLKTIPSFFCSDIVYKFQCNGCNATYYGKTKHHFKIRMCEHLGISALTGKRIKGDDDSVIKDYLLLCDHLLDIKDFSILTANNNNFKLP